MPTTKSNQLPYIAAILLLAVSYAALGELAQLFVIPPGVTAPIWPAAGLALAAILLWGTRMLPGVFIGALSVNVIMGTKNGNFSWDLAHAITASGIAVGACLQAWISAQLVKSNIPLPTRMNTPKSILVVLGLGGAIGCLVNATFSTTLLFAQGILPADAVAINWFTWWVGDAVGVILIAPLLLLNFHKKARQARKLTVTAPSLILMIAVTAVFGHLRHIEYNRTHQDFARVSTQKAGHIQSMLNSKVETVTSIRRLYDASNFVDRSEFNAFTNTILANDDSIVALEWAPKVTTSNQMTIKQQAIDDGLIDFRLHPEADLGENDKAYPVFYINPLDSNKKALGFNLFSNAKRRAAVEKAIKLNRPMASEPITFVQQTDKVERGFLIIEPVYTTQNAPETYDARIENALGVAIGVFNIDDVFESALYELGTDQFTLLANDITGDTPQLLFGLSPSSASFTFQTNIMVADRTWQLNFQPTPAFYKANNSWDVWLVLIGGFLFATLFQALLLTYTEQTENVKNLVDQRTKELNDAQERYNLAVEGASVGLWDWNVKTGHLFWSKRFKNMVGITDEAFVPNFVEFEARLHPDEHQSILKAVEAHITDRTPYDVEYRLRHEDGHYIWIHARGQAKWDDSGNPVRMAGSVEDITSKKQADIDFHELSKRMGLILNNAAEGIYGVDLKGNATFVNQACIDILGYSQDEMIGINMHSLVHDKYPDGKPYPVQNCNIYRAFKDGKIHDEDGEVFWHKDGRAIPVEYSSRPIQGDDGKITGAVVAFRDITLRKAAEKEVLKQKQHLEMAEKVGGVGHWTIDLVGETLYWSEEIYHIHSVDPETYTPTLAEGINFYHPDDRTKVEKLVAKAIEEAEPFEFEFKLVQAGGDIRHVHSKAECITDDEGSVTSIFGTFQDITHRKEAEAEREHLIEQLARSNEELGRFAYVASHDLKEPLRMVTSFTSLLEAEYADQLDDTAKEYIEYAKNGGAHMQALVDDLLEYARLDNEEERIEEVDCNEVVKATIKTLSFQIQESGAKITFDKLPVIQANRLRLGMVFQNIISNGIKYQKAGNAPVIEITHKNRRKAWEFSIKDNGIGIQNEYLDRIFEPFKRLHGKAEYRGTGIGLAIVKKIVEGWNGQVTAKSKPDVGTTITFSVSKDTNAK